MQVILLGGGSACACEHMLGYINNPENSLALILQSFFRSFSHFRSCQIRPIFPILLFWSKLKNACKYVKLAIRYQIINEEGFFFDTLYQDPGANSVKVLSDMVKDGFCPQGDFPD